MNRLRHRVFSGDALVVGSGQALVAVGGLVSAIATARFLGPAGRGELASLQSLAAISAAIGLVGSPTLILRARSLALGESFVGMIRRLSLMATATIAFGIGTLYFVGTGSHARAAILFAALVVASSVVSVASEHFAAHLQADHAFRKLALSRTMWTLAASIAVAIAAGLSATPEWAFLTGVVATASVMFGIRLLAAMRGIPVQEKDSLTCNRSSPGQAFRSALGGYAALLMLLLIYRLDIVMIGLLSDQESVGVYSVALVIAELLWLAANATSVVLAPRALRASPSDARDQYSVATRRALLVTVPPAAFAGLIGQPVISKVFGEAYSESYVALLLLLPGVLAFIPVKLRTSVMIARGRSREMAWLYGGLVILNSVLNLILVPPFAASGAAAATTITYLFGLLVVLATRHGIFEIR